MDVEVQDAWRVDVTRFPELVENVQRLSPNFENSDDDAAENSKKNVHFEDFSFFIRRNGNISTRSSTQHNKKQKWHTKRPGTIADSIN